MATKDRLISAGVLIRAIDADPYLTESEKSYDKCLVHRQPTVDAVQVVHGLLSDPYIDEYYGEFSNCLECGTDNILPCYYCRKCGAKMDGGVRNGL